jgi:hypothetical protein
MKENKETPLVVTTAHRGVFFGFGRPTENKTIKLRDAQMCVYWSPDVKGVLGLAAKGPTRSCRIGPPAPFITLQDVTAVIEASDEARKAWQEQPWS